LSFGHCSIRALSPYLNMSKVFVIGAGLSKALADAPLADELFERIYQKARDQDDDDRPQREDDRRGFNKVVGYLQKETKLLLDFLQQDGTKVKTCEGVPGLYRIDIEYLCTILDLNIERPFIPQGIGVDLKGCPVPYMDGLLVDDLRGARQFIYHYILELLLPEQLSPKADLIDKLFSKVQPGDTIISFNYDILVEQALWGKRIWDPRDGYKIGKIHSHEKIGSSDYRESKVTVFKPHGSINWGASNGNHIEIYTTHPFTNEPLFDGLNVRSERPIPRWKYSFNPHLVIPTFMKTARCGWEFQIIRHALKALSQAKEIFIIGYSLPEADAMANFIFIQIRKNVRIKIIDQGEPGALAERLIESYGLIRKNIVYEQNSIENWITNDFKYTAYEKELERLREIQELCGDTEEPRC